MDPYPKEILPLVCYKKELSVDQLLSKYHDLFVVRLVDGCPEDYFRVTEEGENRISDTVLGGGSVNNLSLHLAGGCFNTECDAHLPFLPIGEYSIQEWTGGKVNTSIVLAEENYETHVPCFGLCFLVKMIHNRTFPFPMHFDSKAERDQYEERVKSVVPDEFKDSDAKLVGAFIDKRSLVQVHPRIKVHHSPTNANYWHMTLDTYRPDGFDYVHAGEKLSSSDRRMFKSFKQDILQNYEINKVAAYKIAPNYYMSWVDLIIHLFRGGIF